MPTPYAAMLDGCVQRFEKAYGPFFLENRQNEANLYAQDDWRVDQVADAESRRCATSTSTRRSEVEDRIDYIFNADDNNIEPRLGFAYAPAWDERVARQAVRRARQLLDSRRLGHLRRPAVPVDLLAGRRQRPLQSAERAQPRRSTTLPNILNVSDPTLGFVFVPGPQTGRVSLTLPDPRPRDAVHDEVEHRLRSRDAVELDAAHPATRATTTTSACATRRTTCRSLRSTGRLPSSIIRTTRRPAGFPDLRGKVIDRDRRRRAVRRHRVLRPRADRRLPERRADRRQRDQLARAAHQRAAARSALHDQPADQQRRRELVRRARDRMGQAAVEGAAVPGGLHVQQDARTRRRRRRSSAPATATRTARTGSSRRASRASTRRTASRSTAAGGCRSSRDAPTWSVRCSAAGSCRGSCGSPPERRSASSTRRRPLDTDFDGFSESSRAVDRRSVGHRGARRRSRHRDAGPAAHGVPQPDVHRHATTTSRRATGSSRRGRRTWTWRWRRTSSMPWQGTRVSVRIEAFNAFNTVKFGFPVNDIANVNFGRLIGAATDYAPRVLQLVLRYRY